MFHPRNCLTSLLSSCFLARTTNETRNNIFVKNKKDYDPIVRQNAAGDVQDGASRYPATRGDRRLPHLLREAGEGVAAPRGGAGVLDTPHEQTQ